MMSTIWIIGYTILLLTIVLNLNVYAKHPEADLNFEDRIRKHGYPINIHKIFTEDDYILPLYQIPYGLEKSTKESTNKSVVVLLHGMGGSPGTFTVLGKRKAVSYYLADRGFDVWIVCTRGVNGPFKEKHKKWDWNKNNEYWLYSTHEIGIYDLTAAVDYILNKTKQQKVFLIGHSAGGSEIITMLSERPEYNDKVKIVVNWGSVPIIKRIDYPLVIFGSALVDLWKGLFKYLGMTEFFPQLQALGETTKAMCADPQWKRVCITATWCIGSHVSVLQHPDDIEVIFTLATQSRISLQMVFQFMDNLNTGEFRKYNYGSKQNMKIYGQKYPPKYNLSACTAPVAFAIAEKDSFIVKEDIYEAVEYLPNVVMLYEIPFKKFTHTDFIFARNADELLYEPTYRMFKDYDEGRIPPRISAKTKNED